MAQCLVSNLKPGDLVDLEGDAYADVDGAHPEFEFEFQAVVAIERETANCVRVDFETCSFGFPPSHRVVIA